MCKSSSANNPVSVKRRAAAFIRLSAVALMTLALIDCGSSSPAAPTGTPAVSAVSLASASVATGGTTQGTISLTGATASAASISLSSSNTAVATVQTPVTIQPGSSSAAFTVTAVGEGTATITASLNGSTRQSPALTVTPRAVVLSAISLTAPSVVGGHEATGTVTLSGSAPAGGAVVTMSGTDPLIVPATITVPVGAASAPFVVSTKAVSVVTAATISGSYGGASVSAPLSVTPPTVATANFGVTGPTETETCTMTNNGNTINCTFNGSTSTAPGTIVAWDWSYSLATKVTQTTSGPVLSNPTVSCSFLPPPPLPPGNPWFTMTVTLKIHDSLGNVSAEAVDNGVRLVPKGVCGF